MDRGIQGTGRSRREGVAAIEFAMVAPLFIVMMLAIAVYGGWFWMAHSVQALAAEGARAAIAGLDANERGQLARTTVNSQARELGLDPALASTQVINNAGAMEISVTYDATDHPLMGLAVMVPKPPALIVRTAIVRLEDY